MPTGIIKAVKVDKGYGFIEPDAADEPDLFFHATALAPPLEFNGQLQGRRVEFQVSENDRNGKLRAVAVRPAR